MPGAVQPLRVAVDTEAAAIRPGARILDRAAPTLVAVAEDVPAERTAALAERAEVVRLPRAAGTGLDPFALLAELHRRDVRAVLLEGGPTLAGSLLAVGLVDRVVGYLAPALLGSGAPVLGDFGVGTISGARRLDVVDVTPVGPDLRITAVPRTDAPRNAEARTAEGRTAPPRTDAHATATEES